MISLSTNNIFEVVQGSGYFNDFNTEFKDLKLKFEQYKERFLSRNQGFLDLPDDQNTLQSIIEFAKTNKSKYDFVVILGIGGSVLGPKTILSTLNNARSTPKVFLADNIDPYSLIEIEKSVDFRKTLFLVQTKSGTTPETIAQYFYFRAKILKLGLEVKDHFVYVTDKYDGFLKRSASEDNITCFDIPVNVGGRFSVLTPVGLLVSALVGLDIQKMLDGAGEIRNRMMEDDKSEAFELAVIQYLFSKHGKTINVLMPYTSQLRTFNDWYVQLLSESIGKIKKTDRGEEYVGITPLPAVGVSDQHSQLQLFKDGPNDKLFIFIHSIDKDQTLQIPTFFSSEKTLEYLRGRSFNELLDAEFYGTQASLTESMRPNLTIQVDKIDEKTLGSLFMFFEISVAFLGELFEINAFDQPGVERSKILTKEILLKTKN